MNALLKIKEKFRDRFFHFLWLILPKNYEMFSGERVPYLRLSWPLVELSDKNCTTTGMVLHHRPSDKIMIFISSRALFPRLKVYHEYCEGKIFRQKKTRDQIFRSVLKKMEKRRDLTSEAYNKDGSGFSEEFIDFLKDWVACVDAHAEAILDEMELAEKELSSQELSSFREEVKERRRFI